MPALILHTTYWTLFNCCCYSEVPDKVEIETLLNSKAMEVTAVLCLGEKLSQTSALADLVTYFSIFVLFCSMFSLNVLKIHWNAWYWKWLMKRDLYWWPKIFGSKFLQFLFLCAFCFPLFLNILSKFHSLYVEECQ